MEDVKRYVARLVRSVAKTAAREAQTPQQPVQLTIAARGILDNLELRPTERRAPGSGEVEIRVAAAGLNFRDVLNALGMYPGDPGALGNECAGTIVALRNGRRVVRSASQPNDRRGLTGVPRSADKASK